MKRLFPSFAALLLVVPPVLAADASLVLDSPAEWQVFQRRSTDRGPVTIAGKAAPGTAGLRYRITGKPAHGKLAEGWQVFRPAADGTFEIRPDVAAGGWYALEVEAGRNGRVEASVKLARFGVGEVFVTAGQSNSTSCGERRPGQTSGLVAAFDGKSWKLAEDPMPGAHDLSVRSWSTVRNGSCWPSFGDAMVAKYRVPVGIAVTGRGSSGIDEWQQDANGKHGAELFEWMMARIKALGPNGFRAVLWHQGETDARTKNTEQYARLLKRVISSSRKEAGWEFPWIVAKVSYLNPQLREFPGIRAAFQKLWDSGVALEGPDSDTLGPEFRNAGGRGIHMNQKGLAKLGQMWAEKAARCIDAASGGR
jgi:hypothetical protein